MEGFLLAPGIIDLSQLRFWAVDGAFDDDFGDADDFSGVGGDDDVYNGGNRRSLAEDDDTEFTIEGSALDIAVFNLVSKTQFSFI